MNRRATGLLAAAAAASLLRSLDPGQARRLAPEVPAR